VAPLTTAAKQEVPISTSEPRNRTISSGLFRKQLGRRVVACAYERRVIEMATAEMLQRTILHALADDSSSDEAATVPLFQLS